MLASKKLYGEIYGLMEDFVLQLGQHMKTGKVLDMINKSIGNAMDPNDIKDMPQLYASTIELNSVFEIVCFTVNNDAETSESVSKTPLMSMVNIGDISRKFDELAYCIFEMAKITKSDIPELKLISELEDDSNLQSFEKIFPESINLFGLINGALLMPDAEILDSVPKGANIISINIKNTTNSVVNIQSMIDNEYVKEHFPELTVKSGLSLNLIKRFNDDVSFSEPAHSPTYSGDIYNIENAYQYIGDNNGKKCYRRLVDYPKLDLTRHYSTIGATIFQANLENKRILMLRNVNKFVQSQVMTDSKIGEIQNGYNTGKTLGGAVVDALASSSLTDEQNLRLLGYSLEYESNSNAPRDDPFYFKKKKNFSNLKNI